MGVDYDARELGGTFVPLNAIRVFASRAASRRNFVS